jgi:hypothetical protein
MNRTNETLIVSGLVELAAGALAGWPYALAISDPQRAGRLGIRAASRLRQWHLDLIALGGLATLVGTAVPDLPRRVAWPLAVGAGRTPTPSVCSCSGRLRKDIPRTAQRWWDPSPRSLGASPRWRR